MSDRPTRRALLRALGVGTASAGLGAMTGLGAATAGADPVAQVGPEEARWTFVPPAENRGLMTQATTSPTVVDGTVYVGTMWIDREASDEADAIRGGVYAIEAGSGEVTWEFETEGGVLGAPHVVDGTVYVIASMGPGSRGPPYFTLYAIDSASATVEWKTHAGHWARTRGSFQRGRGLTGGWGPSPTVYQGTLYVSSLVPPESPGATASGSFVGAFDAADGSFRWQRDLANDIGQYESVSTTAIRMSSPTVQNGLVHVAESGRSGNVLWGLDAESGAVEWRFDMHDGEVDAGIGQHTVADGVVYVDGGAARGNEYRTGFAVDAETGEELREVGGVSDQTLGPYFLTVSDAFETETASIHGFVVQSTETGRSLFASDTTQWVTVADNTVYLCVSALEEAYVSAIDLNGAGEQPETIWSIPFDASATTFVGAPTLADGTLYASTQRDDGVALYAFEAGTQASARDSRVLLGTLGHTDAWTGEDVQWDQALAMPDSELPSTGGNSTATSTATSGTGANSGNGATGQTGGSGAADGQTPGGSGPGMGITATLASLGGASYLLSRRLDDEDR